MPLSFAHSSTSLFSILYCRPAALKACFCHDQRGSFSHYKRVFLASPYRTGKPRMRLPSYGRSVVGELVAFQVRPRERAQWTVAFLLRNKCFNRRT